VLSISYAIGLFQNEGGESRQQQRASGQAKENLFTQGKTLSYLGAGLATTFAGLSETLKQPKRTGQQSRGWSSQPKLADFVQQGFVTNIQQACGLLAVPFRALKRFADRFHLGFTFQAAHE
jgi:hypothetical protein